MSTLLYLDQVVRFFIIGLWDLVCTFFVLVYARNVYIHVATRLYFLFADDPPPPPPTDDPSPPPPTDDPPPPPTTPHLVPFLDDYQNLFGHWSGWLGVICIWPTGQKWVKSL